ncbi:hypothetical protein FF38_09395 [Lucilia cuprina]|uniref:Uncharacterized protein n=1 Tax=Lucilia cuprina TaxID=7375 RepID=A0A0L0CQQ9_LUCCU|nr:hypothetical protein FF38_09395 [Lucilia cuprina]
MNSEQIMSDPLQRTVNRLLLSVVFWVEVFLFFFYFCILFLFIALQLNLYETLHCRDDFYYETKFFSIKISKNSSYNRNNFLRWALRFSLTLLLLVNAFYNNNNNSIGKPTTLIRINTTAAAVVAATAIAKQRLHIKILMNHNDRCNVSFYYVVVEDDADDCGDDDDGDYDGDAAAAATPAANEDKDDDDDVEDNKFPKTFDEDDKADFFVAFC